MMYSHSNYSNHSPPLSAAREDPFVLVRRALRQRQASRTGSLDELKFERPTPTDLSSLQQHQLAAVLSLSKHDRPTMNETRAKTTGDMDGRRNTANAQVLRKVVQQQHLNFAALKRGILSMQPHKQQTQHDAFGTITHVNVTPSPKVESPPSPSQSSCRTRATSPSNNTGILVESQSQHDVLSRWRRRLASCCF